MDAPFLHNRQYRSTLQIYQTCHTIVGDFGYWFILRTFAKAFLQIKIP
jgi:hypothetical protein